MIYDVYIYVGLVSLWLRLFFKFKFKVFILLILDKNNKIYVCYYIKYEDICKLIRVCFGFVSVG